jgi:hypothetical protein
MIQLTAMLVHEDLRDIDAQFKRSSHCVLLPFWSPSPEFRTYDEVPVGPPTTKFAWWFPKESPPYRVTHCKQGRYCLASGSEVIICSRVNEIGAPGDFVMFDLPEHVEIEPGRWEPSSSAFRKRILDLEDALRKLCFNGKDRMLYSNRLAANLLATPEPPEWALRYRRRLEVKAGPPEKSIPHDYDRSFALLRERAGLAGNPRPRVRRRPQCDEDPPGPSLYRTAVSDQRLERITLPGLYIGRSNVTDTTVAGAVLHHSTFNWSDFRNVDFSRCDLRDSDVRACRFESCSFTRANLSQCDLRGSAFLGCDFAGTKLNKALLLESQRKELPLSPEQEASVRWTEEHEEPAGG